MEQKIVQPSKEKIILMDFNTIIDPVSLFTSLIIFHQSHEKLYVRGESLVYQYNYDGMPPTEKNFGRFDDHEAILMASSVCRRSTTDIELKQSNLCLAIRLLQHATKEGFITVIDDHLLGEWARSDKRVPEKEIQDLKSFEYIDKNLYTGARYDSTILQPDAPGRFWDLGMSLKQGWDVALGGRTFSPQDLIAYANVQPKNLGQNKEIM